MRAWRVAKAKRASDLTGQGAAMEGGRWNEAEVPALYMGLSPAICCLETFVHTNVRPVFPLKITQFQLPDDPKLYLQPESASLPPGWAVLPADRASMEFGTRWLKANTHLGLIVPSVVLPLERNIVINPCHPAIAQIAIETIFDFTYDERMFMARYRR